MLLLCIGDRLRQYHACRRVEEAGGSAVTAVATVLAEDESVVRVEAIVEVQSQRLRLLQQACQQAGALAGGEALGKKRAAEGPL
mmetsp:Transcript_36070/g.100094  ORF Transcript_36070/g.100094 Transcript_36070/m.100094 type:complete len:84 (+) Transcript_36070:1022-1273(+)